jgi:Family of unknown function (DUF6912)
MRIYLPATLPALQELQKAGEHGPPPLTAFAVTPALREWYTDDDEEELEYAAFTDAARASLRLLDADVTAPRRRVVLSADVPEGEVRLHPELDRAAVRVAVSVPIAWFAAVHVDGAEAIPDVTAAASAIVAADLGDDDAQFTVDGAEGHELEWYAVQEVPDLLT